VREEAKEEAREKTREKAREEEREKVREKVKMKSEKGREAEKRLGSKGEGRLSFTAEAPSPPQPAGHGGKPSSTGRRPPARAAWSR
jgi:hypothetical protein